MPLIIGCGMRGNWPLPCTPVHSHWVWVVSRWLMVISASTPSTSATQWAWWIRRATMAMTMGMSPMVASMVIGLSLATTVGLMSSLIPILCSKGWIRVGCFISTRLWWPTSAIWGWRIIWVIRVITLMLPIMCSCICTTIATIMIMIMVIIFMPPIIRLAAFISHYIMCLTKITTLLAVMTPMKILKFLFPRSFRYL